jgi:hypothetical protein
MVHLAAIFRANRLIAAVECENQFACILDGLSRNKLRLVSYKVSAETLVFLAVQGLCCLPSETLRLLNRCHVGLLNMNTVNLYVRFVKRIMQKVINSLSN